MIAEHIRHPQYDQLSKYNDIALLKLDKIVVFSANIRPACLCTDVGFEWNSAVAIGFGRLSYGIVRIFILVNQKKYNSVFI